MSEKPTEVIPPEPDPGPLLPPERRSVGEWLFGKPRSREDIDGDPARLLAIGQLTVAAALVSDWLLQRDDPESRAMGERLARVAAWYFEDAKTDRR